MGLLRGITDLLFGDPTEGIKESSDAQIAFQREGLDYLKEINQLPLQYRDQAMQSLMGFYGNDPEVQQQFIDKAKASPFYDAMIKQGQEGVLRNAGSMGLSRSGRAATGLERSNQAVLQGLVNQQLGGLQGFAGAPISGQGVANMYNQMGQTAGAAGMGMVNARQGQLGGLLGGTIGLLDVFY